MTIITHAAHPRTVQRAPGPAAPRVIRPPHRPAPARRVSTRPGPTRPAGAGIRYDRPRVTVSRAAHRPKAVSVAVTAAVAAAAALITLWLGSIAAAGGVSGATSPVPDRLAVVKVEAGESLQQVAARVAPAAPAAMMVDRIKELNGLDDGVPIAGQTLIAPVQ